MTQPTLVRYSTGVFDANARDAPGFDWEVPIPVNAFWDDFKYTTGANFLKAFSQNEVDNMHLERHGDLPKPQKAELMLTILRQKLGPNGSASQPLWESDYPLWYKFMMAVSCMYQEQEKLDLQIQTVEELRKRRQDDSNLSLEHNLAALYTKKKDYAKAEEFQRPVVGWLDEKLGQGSPQALSARRTLAKVAWLQGRQTEAEEVISDIFALIEKAEEDQYAVYKAEEEKLTKELVEELRETKAHAT